MYKGNDSKKLLQITDKVYSIGSKSNEIANLSYVSLNSPELDSILIMCKFYPWIIKYSKLKKLCHYEKQSKLNTKIL